MSKISLAAPRPLSLFLRALLIAAAAVLAGCATPYMDGAVKDVPADQFVRPAQARPVQVVVEFQTNGKANARATDAVKPMVMERVKSTALFSQVDDKPAAGAGLLGVKINNVALMDDAMKKGFMTGLTFGLAGSVVTDGYECVVTYAPPGGGAPIVKTAKHAIHTSMGASDAPPNGVKVASLDEAVRVMVRQIMGLALRDLSQDPAFR